MNLQGKLNSPELNIQNGILGDPLLSPSQLAQVLGVQPKTAERWRMTGEGPPFVRISKRVIRYRLSEVEAFIRSRVASSTVSR